MAKIIRQILSPLMPKKVTILLVLFISCSIYSNAQSMTSRDLLNNLVPHWVFLEELRDDLSKSTHAKYTASLEQAYSFIQLELKDEEEQVFLQIRYQIQSETKLSLYSFYCDNENIAAKLEEKAKELLVNFEWDSPAKKIFPLSQEQILYLEIADRIAKVGNDISAYPSYYSALILTSGFIKLEQINGRNSRSIDHKDSYFLRDLYFLIPLKDKAIKKDAFIDLYFIGAMEILFQDSSAKSQRGTGDEILLQLKKEIKNYK